MKDWTGNKESMFVTLGASNHTDEERESNDFYATDPIAIDKLVGNYFIELPHKIWECACGQGHLSEKLKFFGYEVISTGLVNRGYGGNRFLENNRSAKRLYLHPHQSSIQICTRHHQHHPDADACDAAGTQQYHHGDIAKPSHHHGAEPAG